MSPGQMGQVELLDRFPRQIDGVTVETFININFISLIKKTSDLFFFAESGQIFGGKNAAIAYPMGPDLQFPGGIRAELSDEEAPLP